MKTNKIKLKYHKRKSKEDCLEKKNIVVKRKKNQIRNQIKKIKLDKCFKLKIISVANTHIRLEESETEIYTFILKLENKNLCCENNMFKVPEFKEIICRNLVVTR